MGKGIVQAAAKHQAAFALVDRSIKDAHSSNQVYGKGIESLIEQEARLKGFNDEDLASSFVRLIVGTHDSVKAFKDLTLAEDLARARNIDVSVAALALSRAVQGSTQSLSRFGILVPKVTTAVSDLKAEHDHATAAGVKFTGQLKLEYDQALAAAKAQDKLAGEAKVLAVVQARVGGSASVFAKTAEGQFQRLGVDLHQLKVSIGKDVLPIFTSAAEGIGKYAQALSHSASVQSAVKGGVRDVRSLLHDVRDAAETVGPPLLAVAHAAEAVVGAIGPGPILVAVAAYKTLGFTVNIARDGIALYNRTLATGGAVAVKEAAARKAQGAALTANTEALQANAIALSEHAGASGRSIGRSGALATAFEGDATATEAFAASQTGLVEALAASDAAILRSTQILGGHATAAKLDGVSTVALSQTLKGQAAAVATPIAAVPVVPPTSVAAPAGAAQARASLKSLDKELDAQRAALLLQTQASTTYGNALRGIAPSAEQAAAGEAALTRGFTLTTGATSAVAAANRDLANAASGGRIAQEAQLAAQAKNAQVAAQSVADLTALNASVARLGTTYGVETGIVNASTAANERLAISTLELGAASDAAAVGGIATLARGIGSLSLALVGGWPGVALIGIAALAGGIYYLATQTDAETAANKRLKSSLEDLSTTTLQTASLALQLAQDKNQIAIAKTTKAQQAATVEQARARVESLSGQKGTEKYRTAVLNLNAAIEQQRSDELGVKQAIQSELDTQKQLVASINAEAAARKDAIDNAVKLAAQATRAAEPPSARRGGPPKIELAQVGSAKLLKDDAAAAADLANRLDDLAQHDKKLTPLVRQNVGVLADFIRAIGHVPTARQFRLIIDNKSAKAGLQDMLRILGETLADARREAINQGTKTGQGLGIGIATGVEDERHNIVTEVASVAASARNAFAAALTQGGDIVPPAKIAKAQKTSSEAANALKRLQQDYAATVAEGAQSIRDAQQNLADTITQGNQAVLDAVNQAKQNLNSVGQSLASDIEKFLTARQNSVNDNIAKGPLGKEARRLRALIASGASSDEIRRQAQELSNQAQQRSSAAQFKAQQESLTVGRSLADLTDLFDKGAISVATFHKRILALLKKEGITYKEAGAVLGIAFADGFQGELRGLFDQAGALKNFRTGKFAGTGLEPTIIKPLTVLHDTIKADDKAAQDLRRLQHKEQTKQTTELKKIARATAKSAAADAFLAGLHKHKPKPTGQDGKKARDTVYLGPH